MMEPSISARVAAATEPDPALEATLYDYIGNDYTTALFPNEASWVRYYYNQVDLNDDGTDETLVLLTGSLFCGTGGCGLLVLQEDSGAYDIVADIALVTPPLLVSEVPNDGWRDLIVFVAGGGAEGGYRVLRFDGTSYPANASIAEPLTTPVSVTAYLDNDLSTDKGFLLRPEP
jgi:putative lipoprotein